MSFDCDYCDKGFSSEKEKLEHELETHEDELSSHAKGDKKSQLNKLKQKKKTKKHNRKQKLQYGAISIFAVLLVAAGGFYAYNATDGFSSNVQTNQSIGVGEPIHWHSDYQITVCGQERVLQGGPTKAHTHGETTFHLEGVRTSREQATLDWVVDQLGGQLSNDSILGYQEPESCEGSSEPGNLTVKVNGNVLETPEDYIIRDGDFIRIKYG